MFNKLPKFQRLTELVHLSKTAEALDDLPDRLEKILECFNSSHIHPQFRTDIYEVLTSSSEIATALSTPSYDARSAVKTCTQMLSVLSRIIVHLECERPAFAGWGILLTTSKSLYPASFNTEEEAYKVMDHLGTGGTAAEVIPIRITSDFAVRPTIKTLKNDSFSAESEVLAPPLVDQHDPIPSAVLPKAARTTFGGPVGEAFVEQFNAAKNKYQQVDE